MTDEATTRNVLPGPLNDADDDIQAGFNRSLAVVIGIDGYDQYPYGIPRVQTPVGDA